MFVMHLLTYSTVQCLHCIFPSARVKICDGLFSGLSEEKVWTKLKNNLSPQTSVTSADQEGKAVLQITYNVTDEQVHSESE